MLVFELAAVEINVKKVKFPDCDPTKSSIDTKCHDHLNVAN